MHLDPPDVLRPADQVGALETFPALDHPLAPLRRQARDGLPGANVALIEREDRVRAVGRGVRRRRIHDRIRLIEAGGQAQRDQGDTCFHDELLLFERTALP
jgi:hypothetical protein